MRWVPLLGLLLIAANFPGEQPTYSRDTGFEQHLFYGTSGGATDQVEYVCRAFPGRTGSDDLTSSVWQVLRLSYNAGGQVTDVEFAGDDDAFTNQCSNRTGLDYD